MIISFCTACANRLYQFSQTFEQNVEIIRRNPATEWVILNFNSKDGLHEFMLERMDALPPRIIYAQDLSGRAWHASLAKNIAHRISSGDVLMNLDGDNYLGESVESVQKHFAGGGKVLHLWSKKWGDGTYGRIAIDRTVFFEMRGYDESFYPMGYQDADLLLRAKALKHKISHVRAGPDMAIRNTKTESVAHCRIGKMKWNDFNRLNRAKSGANLKLKQFIANTESDWGMSTLKIVRGTLETTSCAAFAGAEDCGSTVNAY